MFKYKKSTHELEIYCPQCHDRIKFQIPPEVFEKEHSKYPFSFRHIHGNPPHSCTLYIDKNGTIRGHEFGDSIQLSDEIITDIFNKRSLTKKSDTNQILKTIINVFYTVIETSLPNADTLKFKIGKKLGIQLAKLFDSNEMSGLFEELKEFWQTHGLGNIRDISIEEERVNIRIYECYECGDLPNLGRPVCKMDEGVLTSIFKERLKKDYIVEEIECMAMGSPYCEFDIMEFEH